jgi:hypothetical protein
MLGMEGSDFQPGGLAAGFMPVANPVANNIAGMPGFGSRGALLVPSIPNSGGFSSFMQAGAVPSVPDPLSFLPAQVRDVFKVHSGGSEQNGRGRLTCPAMYDLPGWNELPETTQQMFEVEACQVLAEHSLGLGLDGGLSQLLGAKLSHSLRRFLEGAFESCPQAQQTN